jgi:hypothetical protein
MKLYINKMKPVKEQKGIEVIGMKSSFTSSKEIISV